MRQERLPLLLALALLLLLASTCVFRVAEDQLALRLRFGGDVIADNYAPGLHFKWPWGIDEVRLYDRRVQDFALLAEPLRTRDSVPLRTDISLYWQVTKVAEFHRAAGESGSAAIGQVAQKVRESVRAAVARADLNGVLSIDADRLGREALEAARGPAADMGVTLVAVQLTSLTPGEDMSEQFAERMRQGFTATALQLRAGGTEEAQKIRAEAEAKRGEILARAQREAAATRGQADAEAARIDARTFSRNPEFQVFWHRLETYRRTLGTANDVLVLGPDNDFLKYLRAPSGR